MRATATADFPLTAQSHPLDCAVTSTDLVRHRRPSSRHVARHEGRAPRIAPWPSPRRGYAEKTKEGTGQRRRSFGDVAGTHGQRAGVQPDGWTGVPARKRPVPEGPEQLRGVPEIR